VRWLTAPTHCISLLAVHHNGAAVQRGKVDDAMTSQVLPQPTRCISAPSSKFGRKHVFLVSKTLLSQLEAYKYPETFMQSILERT
jgi:hypothetical protein